MKIIDERERCDNAIQEIISNTSKFEKLNQDSASLQRFLCKLKQKNFLNENEYDKLYSSGSAPARIYSTLKMHKFSSSDSFSKLRPILSCTGTFNYITIIPRFFVISFHLQCKMITLAKILFFCFSN